jgi:hypothetical protein
LARAEPENPTDLNSVGARLNKATKFIADVVKTGVERGIYAASAYGCQSSLKRHECRAPLPLTKVFGPLELFIRKELGRCV